MGNELNFDELDKAVSNYMNKSADPAPTATPTAPVEPSPNPIPVSASTPTPVFVPREEVESPATVAAPVASSPTPSVTPASSAPRIQVRSRQSIAGRRAAGGSTFHDIMPGHRRSAVASGKPLTPLRDTTLAATPVPPAKAPLPEETSKSNAAAETPAPATPSPAPEAAPISEVDRAPSVISTPPVAATDAPKILGSPENAPTTKPELALPTTNKAESPDASEGLLVQSANRAVSDALLEDLRKESEAASQASDATDPPVASSEKSSTMLGSEATGLLAKTPLELEDNASDDLKKAPATQPVGGLMDTGEIHQTAGKVPVSPVDASHMLDAGEDDTPAMQVFDTKQYHTPIAGHNDSISRPKSKKWEIIVVTVAVVVVIAAALVAYMMFFGAE